MRTLLASNKACVSYQPVAYTALPYQANVISVKVSDVTGFTNGDRVLWGTLGTEDAEVCTAQTVTTATNTLTLASGCKKPHSESSPVTVLKYDKVQFYWCSTSTFNALTPVGSLLDIDPTNFNSSYIDSVHQTGYGFFKLSNSVRSWISAESNAIPYAGFGENTVKYAIDHFFSLVNQADARLISREDVLRWLNEAYTLARGELGMVNADFYASEEVSLDVVPGTQEYFLPDRFSDMVYVRRSDNGNEISPVHVSEIPRWAGLGIDYRLGTLKEPRYYIRGNMIGFVPDQENTYTVLYRYDQLKSQLISEYDSIDIPDGNFFFLVDYALYRSAPKRNASGVGNFQAWRNGVDNMKIISVNRGSQGDSWNVNWSSIA